MRIYIVIQIYSPQMYYTSGHLKFNGRLLSKYQNIKEITELDLTIVDLLLLTLFYTY